MKKKDETSSSSTKQSRISNEEYKLRTNKGTNSAGKIREIFNKGHSVKNFSV